MYKFIIRFIFTAIILALMAIALLLMPLWGTALVFWIACEVLADTDWNFPST